MARAYTRRATKARRKSPPKRAPEISLEQAVDIALRAIDRAKGEQVGVFMSGGKIRTARKHSSTYEVFMERMAGGLVGVYDDFMDEGALKEDISIFYGEHV